MLALSDKLEGQGIPASRGAVRGGVGSTVDGAVGRAGLGILADIRVPRVAGVAVRVAVFVVDPAPVGVDGDLAVYVGAGAAGAALLPGHLGMGLGRLLAHLLGGSRAHEGGEREDVGAHFGQSLNGEWLWRWRSGDDVRGLVGEGRC